MGQFSVKILPLTGSVLGGNQHADIASSVRRKAKRQNYVHLSPFCLEAVQRIDALFEIEREINGLSADERKAARQIHSAPLVTDLHA